MLIARTQDWFSHNVGTNLTNEIGIDCSHKAIFIITFDVRCHNYTICASQYDDRLS